MALIMLKVEGDLHYETQNFESLAALAEMLYYEEYIYINAGQIVRTDKVIAATVIGD